MRQLKVAAPIGVIDDWNAILQTAVPGERLSDVILSAGLVRGVVSATKLFHATACDSGREWSHEDEFQQLSSYVNEVAGKRQDLRSLLFDVLAGYEKFLPRYASSRTGLLHRDLHPGNILVDEGEISLIDLDLCSNGDPAIDLGNLLGHFVEEGLRARRPATEILLARTNFYSAVAVSYSEQVAEAALFFSELTLLRHVYLSTRYPARAKYSLPILLECQKKLQTRIRHSTRREVIGVDILNEVHGL